MVMADPDAMNQVFGNLVENALKYGKEGKRILVGAQLLRMPRSTSVCGILDRASPPST